MHTSRKHVGTLGVSLDADDSYTRFRYPYQTQEAQTRRLADFAFMICDYRLASSVYETARKDFTNDKAWRYYASATVRRFSPCLVLTSSGQRAYLAGTRGHLAADGGPHEPTAVDIARLRSNRP